MFKRLKHVILPCSRKREAAKFYLEIPTVIGAEDEQATGNIIFHIPSNVTHIRFANSRGALQFMPWEEVFPRVTEVHRPWSFMGVANAAKQVFAEARLEMETGHTKHVIISALEGPRQPGLRRFPIDHVGWPHASEYLIQHDFTEHVHQWASYHDKCKNVWYPMYLHPDKYAWNSNFERGPDKGETPMTCLAMHNYFRWHYPTLKYANLDGLSFKCEMAFEGDMKGATAHLFVLLADKVNGETLTTSGRYHQNNPSQLIKLPVTGDFATTAFTIDSEGWMPYYRRNNGDLNDGVKPDLRYVDGFGIAFHNFKKDMLPEGILKCRRWEFKF